MKETSDLFTELNSDTAFSLFLIPPKQFVHTIEVGAKWISDESSMANEYAMSANLLRDAAIKSGTPWFYANPIIYLYRHALELYLKAILQPNKPTHNLLKLRDALITYIKGKYEIDIADGWAIQIISEFASLDPSSTRLRYAKDNSGKPSFAAEQRVNLEDLKMRMDALFQSLIWLAMNSVSPAEK